MHALNAELAKVNDFFICLHRVHLALLVFDATATPIVKSFESVLLTPDLAMETKALVRYQDLVNQLQLYNAVNAGQLFDLNGSCVVLYATMLVMHNQCLVP